MKTHAFFLAALLANPWAQAQQPVSQKAILGENPIEGMIETSKLECHNGNPPMEFNFPFPASVELATANISVTQANGILIKGLPNSSIKKLGGTLGHLYFCSELPMALQPGQPLRVSGTQTFWELLYKRSNGTCQKLLVEEMKLDVGPIQFHGRHEMSAYPIDAVHCANL